MFALSYPSSSISHMKQTTGNSTASDEHPKDEIEENRVRVPEKVKWGERGEWGEWGEWAECGKEIKDDKKISLVDGTIK